MSLLQDVLEENCYFVGTEQPAYTNTETANQELFQLETTLLNGITIYGDEQAVSKITKVRKPSRTFGLTMVRQLMCQRRTTWVSP